MQQPPKLKCKMPLIFANIGLFKASFAMNFQPRASPHETAGGKFPAFVVWFSRFNAFPPAFFRATMMLKAEDLSLEKISRARFFWF